MSARFDSEVMFHLEKMYQEHLINEAVRPSRRAARVSDSNQVLFVPPGQNASAALERFHEVASDEIGDSAERFAKEEILQPRRLSLRVF